MSISTVKEYDLAKWHSVASAVQPEVRLFIDGEYVDAIEGGRFETVNPALRRHETIGERQGQVLRQPTQLYRAQVGLDTTWMIPSASKRSR